MKATIVGIKRGKTKNNVDCFNYYGVKEFTDYDKANNECSGQDVVSAFSYTDYNLKVGDLVDFQYEPGFKGMASLSDIVMVKPVDGTPFDKDKEKASK